MSVAYIHHHLFSSQQRHIKTRTLACPAADATIPALEQRHLTLGL